MSILIRFVQRIEWKRTSLHLCFLFAHTFHESSSASSFFCVKYSKWMRRNWKKNIQMFDIKNHIIWFFFSFFPFVSFLFHSITQFGFTHSETIKSSWFSLFFCYYPFFWFNTFVLKKIEYWQNIHEKKEHNNNNIMKYVWKNSVMASNIREITGTYTKV